MSGKIGANGQTNPISSPNPHGQTTTMINPNLQGVTTPHTPPVLTNTPIETQPVCQLPHHHIPNHSRPILILSFQN